MQSIATTPALLAETLPHRNPNRRDLLELLIGYGAILLVLWTPPPFQRPLYFVAATLLLAASLRPRADSRTLGFTTQNLAKSSLILLPVTALTAAGIALAVSRPRPFTSPQPPKPSCNATGATASGPSPSSSSCRTSSSSASAACSPSTPPVQSSSPPASSPSPMSPAPSSPSSPPSGD